MLPLGLMLLLGAALAGCDVFDPKPDGGSGRAEVVWTMPKTDPYDNHVQPIIDGDRAFVSTDGRLFALDLGTGEEQWSVQIGREAESLHADGDRLYLHVGGAVRAFEKATGRAVWTASLDDIGGSAFNKLADDGEHLYLGRRGAVQQIHRTDGTLSRRYVLSGLPSVGQPETEGVFDVAVGEGLLVAPVNQVVLGDSVAIRGGVYGFDTATGEERWRYEVPLLPRPGPYHSYPAVGAVGAVITGGLVVVSASSRMLALDAETGEVVWDHVFDPELSGVWVGPTVAGEGVYVGTVTQRAHRLDLHSGEIVWSRLTDGSMQPTITVRDGRVYFTNNGWGELWVLDEETGEPVWHGRPPGYGQTRALYLSPPAVGDEMMVIVGDQFVYGLTKP